MHNLHFLVLKADSPQDACAEAEDYIMDFGNENNWRTVCGCVSKRNQVFINDADGRYSPEQTGYTTIAKINRAVRRWINGDGGFGLTAKTKIAKAKKKIDLSKWNTNELFSLERYAKHLYQKAQLGGKKFNVLEDCFYPNEYTECGVTQIEGGEGKRMYVVFIDMHD